MGEDKRLNEKSTLGRREVLKSIGLASAAFVTGGVFQTINSQSYASDNSAGIHSRVQQLDAAAESFATVNLNRLNDGDLFIVRSWHRDRDVGGGLFYWDQHRNKSDHNGGTIISPTVPPVSLQRSGNLYNRTASFLEGAGEQDPSGRGCFVRSNYAAVLVEYFGYASGCEIPALLAASHYSAQHGLPVHVVMEQSISTDRFIFPSGCKFTSDSVLRLTYSGGNAGPTPFVVINDGFEAGTLILRTQVRTLALCHILGNDVTIGRLLIEDPSMTSEETAVTVYGDRFQADLLQSSNFGRPFAFTGSDSGPCKDIVIGRVEIENYIRGIGLTYVENIEINTMLMSKRHPSARKAPGHNAILCSSVQGLTIDEADIRDTSEHAFRVGGNSSLPGAGNTTDINIHRWTVHRSGGCAFKINPDPGQRCERGYVTALLGDDISDGVSGGNAELLRLTRMFDADFGTVASYFVDRSNQRKPVRNALRTAESSNVHIGMLTADATHNPFISFEESTDSAEDATRGLFIDRVVFHNQYSPTELVRFEAVNFTPGDIYIRGIDASNINGSTAAIYWIDPIEKLPDAPIVVQGHIELSGGNTMVNRAPSTYLAWMDIRSGNRVITSPMSFSSQPGQHVFTSGPFTDSDAPSNGITISAPDAQPGDGNYGGSIVLSRPGSTRRGGAITIRQQSNNEHDLGLAFFAGSSQVKTDALRELMELSYDGHLELKQNSKGIRLKSPNGTTYLITVDDSGNLQVQ